jgi:hypothetical protein
VNPLTAKALVRPDLERDGVTIAVRTERGGILNFADVDIEWIESENPATQSEARPLHLSEDSARAVYEALGRYFGGDVVNAVALRKDYDAERSRVDKMINNLMMRSQ